MGWLCFFEAFLFWCGKIMFPRKTAGIKDTQTPTKCTKEKQRDEGKTAPFLRRAADVPGRRLREQVGCIVVLLL